jgi:hypothetical protein
VAALDFSIARHEQRLTLFKNTVKWNLGALVAGILFLQIWFRTRWARPPRKHRTSHAAQPAAAAPIAQKPVA